VFVPEKCFFVAAPGPAVPNNFEPEQAGIKAYGPVHVGNHYGCVVNSVYAVLFTSKYASEPFHVRALPGASAELELFYQRPSHGGDGNYYNDGHEKVAFRYGVKEAWLYLDHLFENG